MQPSLFSFIRRQKKLTAFLGLFLCVTQLYGISYGAYLPVSKPSVKESNSATSSSSSNSEDSENISNSDDNLLKRTSSLLAKELEVAPAKIPTGTSTTSTKTLSAVLYGSDIKQGIIGKDALHPIDHVYDNVFNINIKDLPKNAVASLEYDLYGVSNYMGVSKVVNDAGFTGGISTEHNKEWIHQSEPIVFSNLVEGLNTVIFTISPTASYTYKVRDVRIKITPTNTDQTGFSVASTLLKGTVFKEFKKGVKETLSLGTAKLETSTKSLEAKNVNISISPLELLDIPAMAPEMVNVTSGDSGYRFLPHGEHFKESAKVSLGYDKNKIPKGYTESDIKTFYFDRVEKKWVALPKEELSTDNQTITSNTTHFTDMINGVIQVPESPETGSYAPNSIKDIKAADPSAGIVSIAPPSPNNQGTVNTSFPIKLPEGRKGVAPSLAISYSSDGGNGWLGLGWDLSVPSISLDTRWGVPRYDAQEETEIYTLGGEQLTVKVGDKYLIPNREKIDRQPAGTQFYPRIESGYSKIIRHGNSPANYNWEVKGKDGSTSYFGGHKGQIVENAVQRQPGTNNIGNWTLYRTEDANGNYVQYNYTHSSYQGSPGKGGQEFYIESIEYTKHISEEFKQAPYVVTFERENTRRDVQIEARLGFVRVTSQKLKKIEVKHKDETIRSYGLEYQEGVFHKTLLTSISEYDKKGDLFYTNRMEYNNEVKDKGGLFAKATTEKLQNPIKETTPLSNNVSKSKTVGLAATVGIAITLKEKNPMTKSATLGPNYSYTDGNTFGQTALMDLTGNGLPDQVYIRRGSSQLNYLEHKKTKKGVVERFKKDIKGVVGSTAFSKGKNYTNAFGFEISAGVGLASANINGSIFKGTSITTNYVTDVNSDGIPDIVDNGVVKFGYIENGELKYSTESKNTPNPITSGTIDIQADPEEEKNYRSEGPLMDVVKVWKSPYTGTINIKGSIALDGQSVDGANFMLQHSSNELVRSSINKGEEKGIAISSRPIKKGDYVYFRLSSKDNGSNDLAKITAEITFTNIVLPSGALVPVSEQMLKLDENYYTFNLEKDYLFTSEAGIGAPLSGAMVLSGTFTKPETTDNVNLVLVKTATDGVVTETVLREFGRQSATEVSINQSINVSTGETFKIIARSPSNVDWSKIDVQNLKAVFTGVIEGEKESTEIILYPILTKEFYNWKRNGVSSESSVPARANAFNAQMVKVSPQLVLRGVSGQQPFTGDITFSAKRYDKQGVLVDANHRVIRLVNYTEIFLNKEIIDQNTIDFTGSFNHDNVENIVVNYYLVNATLNQRIETAQYNIISNNGSSMRANANIFVKHNANAAKETSPGSKKYETDKENDGRFGPMYRGWGQFAYNGGWGAYENSENPRYDQKPIEETKLEIDFTDTNNGVTKPEDSQSVAMNKQRWYQMQTYSGDDPSDESGKSTLQLYMAGKENVSVSAGQLSASRMGPDSIEELVGGATTPGLSGYSAPRKIVKTSGKSAGLGASVGNNFGANTNGGSSKSVLDYMDLNGDGYPDILNGKSVQYTNTRGAYGKTESNVLEKINESSSTGNGFSAGSSFSMPNSKTVSLSENAKLSGSAGANLGAGVSTGKDKQDFYLMDVNGDGLPDKVSNNGKKVALNLGYGFGQYEEWNQTLNRLGESSTSSFSGGISGNGKIEKGKTLLNGSLSFGTSSSTTQADQKSMLLDINGDGLPDKIDGDKIYLNTGNGFIESEYKLPFIDKSQSDGKSKNLALTACILVPITLPYNIKICANPSYSWGDGNSNSTHQIQDIDGDGFPDLLVSETVGSISQQLSNIGTTNILKKVITPMGGSWEVTYKREGNTYDLQSNRYVLESLVVDDGFAEDDIYKPGVSKITVEYSNPYHSRRERTFYGFGTLKVNQIDTKNTGAASTVVYRSTEQTINNSSYFLKGALLSEALYESSNKTKWTENTTSYSLRNRDNTSSTIVPLEGESEKNLDNYAYFVTSDKTVETRYEKSRSKSTTSENKSYNSTGDLTEHISTGDQQIGSREVLSSKITYSSPKGSTYIVRPESIVSTATGVKRARNASYDAKGNLTSVTMLGPGNPTIEYEYDIYGNITKVTYPANEKGQKFWRKYTYDDILHAFPIKVEDAFGYSSTTEYDYSFQVPTFTEDMNLQPMQYEYDAKGRNTVIVGPYELYNDIPFTIQMDYHPVTDAPENKSRNTQSYATTKHYDPEHRGKYITTYTISDGLGSPIQVKKSSFVSKDANSAPREAYIVSPKTVMDAFGRALETYYPTVQSGGNIRLYDVSKDNIEPTRITYDAMDRVLTTKLPGEQLTSTVVYDISSVKRGSEGAMFHTQITDELGTIKHSYTDMKGRTILIHEPSNSGDIFTNFKFDALGQILEVTDVENNKTLSEYDDLGRRTKYTHPDSGTMTMSYDALGNPTSRTNSEGETTKYIYDYGRLSEVQYSKYAHNNVRYFYGPAGNSSAMDDNAVGRLWYQTDATGAQYLRYGQLGELTYQRRSISSSAKDVLWFETSWEYDTWNRVKNITYPDGEVVNYNYNVGGLLASVGYKKANENEPNGLVKDIWYDKFEQKVYQEYGNNTVTRYEYETERRRLLKMKTQNSARTFMDNLYRYDAVSNITALLNNAPIAPSGQIGGGSNYAYTYDDLYRLTSAAGNWRGNNAKGEQMRHRYTYAMTYDNMHNITRKVQNHESTLGSKGNKWQPAMGGKTSYTLNYKYESSKPHAPSTVIDQPNVVPGQSCCNPDDPGVDFKNYTYDNKGNPLSIEKANCKNKEAETTYLWDEENRLLAVDTQPSTKNFNGVGIYTYDAGGERVVKAVLSEESVTNITTDTTGYKKRYRIDENFYPNGLLVMRRSFNKGKTEEPSYTKHYYIGTQRITAKLGKSTTIGRLDCNSLIIPFGSGGTSINQKEASKQQSETLNKLSQEILSKWGINGIEFGQGAGYNDNCTNGHDAPESEKLFTYWYHTDHLGSSSYITGEDGEVNQNIEYFPSGETFVENHKNSYNTPFKYNGKEQDSETGYYYYGARYYNPRVSLWLNVDPLAEILPSYSPYAFVRNNPINKVDPTGMLDGWIEEIDKNGNISITYDRNVNTKQEAIDAGYKNTTRVSTAFNINVGEKTYELTSQGSIASEGNIIGNNVNLGGINVSTPESFIYEATESSNYLTNWAKSNNFLAKLSYNMANDVWGTAQIFLNLAGINTQDESNRNPFTGANYGNLDGSPNYNQIASFANTVSMLVPAGRAKAGAQGLGYISERAVPYAPHFGKILNGVYVNTYSAKVINYGFNQWNNNISQGGAIIKASKAIGNKN